MQTLEGKVAFVTGGAQGLGEATCAVLAQSGARVVCADIREDAGAALVKRLNGSGMDASFVRLDVADENAVRSALDAALSRCGRLDILVNNAGIDVTLPIDEMTSAQWDRIINVNLRGPFLISRHALGIMKANRSGHIVNIASTAAKRAWANASAYHASKWGLLGFSHALHVEARKFNIKVTAVVSGGMRTPFLLERFPDIDINCLQDPDNVAQTIRFILMQPNETVIPEIMVLPMNETSWP